MAQIQEIEIPANDLPQLAELSTTLWEDYETTKDRARRKELKQLYNNIAELYNHQAHFNALRTIH